MIHRRQSVRGDARAQARVGSRRPLLRHRFGHLAVLVALVGQGACGDDAGTPPESLRFGQIGRVDVVLSTPIGSGNGKLEQRVSWGSSGEWSLQESISYGSLLGDDWFENDLTDLGTSAASYYDAIIRWNSGPGEELLVVDDLPSGRDPECGTGDTRVTFSIHDEAKKLDRTWVRCGDGSLGTIDPASGRPDAGAARVLQAVQTVRRATVGDQFRSRYAGSLPFGTLDRGEVSGSTLTSPTTFTNFDPWQTFWAQHAGVRPIPPVDFDSMMVVVAMVGTRGEAGDSVSVRRILRVDGGAIIEYVERVPGNFCSPAGRTLTPFHVVVVPRTPGPFQYRELPREEISCGG